MEQTSASRARAAAHASWMSWAITSLPRTRSRDSAAVARQKHRRTTATKLDEGPRACASACPSTMYGRARAMRTETSAAAAKVHVRERSRPAQAAPPRVPRLALQHLPAPSPPRAQSVRRYSRNACSHLRMSTLRRSASAPRGSSPVAAVRTHAPVALVPRATRSLAIVCARSAHAEVLRWSARDSATFPQLQRSNFGPELTILQVDLPCETRTRLPREFQLDSRAAGACARCHCQVRAFVFSLDGAAPFRVPVVPRASRSSDDGGFS